LIVDNNFLSIGYPTLEGLPRWRMVLISDSGPVTPDDRPVPVGASVQNCL
jgi:hypothetical protein